MSPALRILEEWTTHQDYLWFLALIAWGGVMGGEIRPKKGPGAAASTGWLIALAAGGAAGALLELTLLAQHLQAPREYAPYDFAMGAAQAAGTGALIWGATVGVELRVTWRVMGGVVLASLVGLRQQFPVAGGFGLVAVQLLALVGVTWRGSRQISKTVTVLLAVMPLIATHGPLAYLANEGRKITDWSHFALFAAAISLAAGLLLAARTWRRRLDQAVGEQAVSPALRRDLRRAVIALAVWLVAGVLVAVWYGRIARQAFEENLLRRIDTAVLALDERTVLEALGPALKIEAVEQRRFVKDDRPVLVARAPYSRAEVYTTLRTQLARVRERNKDFQFLYIATWRSGHMLVLNSLPRKDDVSRHVIHHQVTPADLERLADRKSFLEGPVITESWLPQFSAKAVLRHPETGLVLGWLVADIEATHWLTTFRQARLQTMVLAGAGVGLWALAVAYRLRREASDAAEQKAAAAAAADRMKSAFLAKVSHELRTPIQSILGYGELLESAPLPDAHRGWLAALRSHGDIMLRLVNDLIDLGALQSGAFQLELRPVALRTLIEECATALRPAASAKGLLFQTELAANLPAWVRADDIRLRQILLNLLNNAVKFTAVGKVTLTVRRVDDGPLEFVVADTGPGIPSALRTRLFQPFARLDPAAGGGSGLGLALVQGLCGVMGGTVRLAEGAGEGATFIVQLPLPRSEPPPGATVVPEGATPSLVGLRVLVAEDNTLVRELLVAFLTEHGADVIVAQDGVTALELARERVADVMLLDIGLPNLDGITVAETLRAEGLGDLRIIGLSAHVTPSDEARARRAGMDAFLGKPVRLATLAATIIEQMRGGRAKTAAAEKIADPRLRQRLIAQFASETPGVLAEMRTALTAGDWPRLRGRAHYLKNSADVLGVVALQEACQRLAALEKAPAPLVAQQLLEKIEHAVPSDFGVLADLTATDK